MFWISISENIFSVTYPLFTNNDEQKFSTYATRHRQVHRVGVVVTCRVEMINGSENVNSFITITIGILNKLQGRFGIKTCVIIKTSSYKS